MGGSYQWREEQSSSPDHFSKWVELGSRGSEVKGFLCYSQAGGPGVLVLHEFFGLQDSFKDYAASLSREGFTVLAPDLYDGVIAGSVDEATEMTRALDSDRAMTRLQAAVDFLADNWHPRLGTVGFSLGGMFANEVARVRPVEATVLYYAWGETNPEGFNGAVQAHLATDDEWEPLDDMKQAIAGFRDAGVDVDAHFYPDTGHWFANPAVPSAYKDAEATLAFERTVSFLRHHLA